MAYTSKLRARALLGSAASSLVLGALLSAGLSGVAAAQDKAKPANAAAAADGAAAEGTEVEQVVVTGTFLRGTPATAVVPVEGVNLQELRDRGSPSNVDFVKGLSEIGSVAGEANRLNAFAIGAASINLRSLGSQRTVVVFNGRRFPEQYSFSVGRFNNINQIPNAAIGRVEVLKDGGATTYGADAVGGVVNYITRRNLNGIEVQANYRYIKDSQGGDYDGSISMGKVGDDGKWNIMGVLGYQKRNELDLMDRDWALQPYLMNPSSWNNAGSPGAYAFAVATTNATTNPTFATITRTGTTSFTTSVNGTPTTGTSAYVGDREWGATGITRDPSCTALGGFAGWSATPSAICYMQFGYLSNLVEEQETWQGYAEGNYEFSPKFKVHGEFTYYGLDIPRIPIDNGGALPGSFPLLRNADGTLATTTVTIGGVTSTVPSGAGQTSPGAGGVASSAYYVAGTNPAVGVLAQALKGSNGATVFTTAQLAALTGMTTSGNIPTGRVALAQSAWRPFGVGGNPIYGETDFQHNYSKQYRYTLDFSGDLGKFLGGSWDWDFAYTLNTLDYTLEATDMLVDRLQASLNGYGGSSCNNIRADLPGSTCKYFNPFASAVEKNIFTGAVNPGFVGTGTYAGYMPGKGLQNDPDLIRWMYVPMGMRRQSQYDIFDFVLRGELGYHLWSQEPIQLAIGAQYRELHEISDLTDFADEFTNPCPTAGVTTCTSRTSPLVFRRGVQISGFTRDYNRRYPVESAFAEIKIPVTDKLNAQVSTRWERFISDLDAKNNEVVVAQGAVRYQALPWLAFRATGGQTFSQINPPAPVEVSGVGVTTGVTLAAALGGTSTYTSLNWPNTGVKPETGFNYNLGTIITVGSVTATIDYYSIKLENLARAGSSAALLTAVSLPGATGAQTLINCSSDLITQANPLFGGLPAIIGGAAQISGSNYTPAPCVQGTTTVQNYINGGQVNFYGTQGQQTALTNGGTLETAGIDFSVNWRGANVLGGDLSLGADGSYILKYGQSDYRIDGILIAPGYDDGIGAQNSTAAVPARNGQRVAQFRGSINANWRFGRHNFNWRTNMVSSLVDDQASDFQTTNPLNANIGNAQGFVVPGGACSAIIQSPPVPNAAGTGVFGGPGLNISALTGTPVGFDACQNVYVTSAMKIPAWFNSDFTYRLSLPKDLTATLTVQNVFDTDPKFNRDPINYDAGSGSPLGRTFRVGVLKKW